MVDRSPILIIGLKAKSVGEEVKRGCFSVLLLEWVAGCGLGKLDILKRRLNGDFRGKRSVLVGMK